MDETALDLLRQGRKSQIWTKYCGFLDLNIDEFMKIQERLLLEQINLLSKTEIGKRILGDRVPKSVNEFRRIVPISCYEDYEALLDPEVCRYPNVYQWAHTSGRSGRYKWVPYTEQSYRRLGERVLSGIILACARERGDMRLEEHDVLVTNTPPRPYISGVSLHAMSEQFNFTFIPSVEESEDIDFQARIEQSFAKGLETGIDILGSMSVVLVKMGERFADGARGVKLSKQMLKPRVLFRMLRAFAKSKLENRNVLPKDLWTLKALPCGGADTALYKDKIEYYWGAEPYDMYGCTEEGAIAAQAWNKKYLTFFPDAAFYEFIPEEEWYKWRLDPSYIPSTVLFDEVVPNKKYELVLSNYYGKPLLRYRTYDLIEFPVLQDTEAGINLPQMSFVGRVNDFIDLAGFTGLIDEKMVYRAIANTGIAYKEWAIRKEASGGEPILRLYMEPDTQTDKDTIRNRVHEALKDINSFYADYESMIEKPALEVTLLQPGTFQAYMLEKQAEGADLAHLKPPRMNPTDEVIDTLMKYNGNHRS